MTFHCVQCHASIPRNSSHNYYCVECFGLGALCETCHTTGHVDCGTVLSSSWFRYITLEPSTSKFDLLQCSTVSAAWDNRPMYVYMSVNEPGHDKSCMILRDMKEEEISQELYGGLVELRNFGWQNVWIACLCTDDSTHESAAAMERLSQLAACQTYDTGTPSNSKSHDLVRMDAPFFDHDQSLEDFDTITQSTAMRLDSLELPDYQYTALSDSSRSIRLLKLEQLGSDPAVQVFDADLDTAPPYTALSYTWGSSTTLVPLTCNGSTKLSVRPSLACALYDLLASGYEYLWIDAICINQQDLEEKSAQVARMADIYRGAEEVVVHLFPECGKKNCHHLLALEHMEKLASVSRANRRIKTRANTWQDEFNKYGIPDMSDPAWSAWVDLRLSPWFARSWVMQEAVVNRNVQVLFHGAKFNLNTLLLANKALEQEIIPIRYPRLMTTRDNLLAVDHIRREHAEDPNAHSLRRVLEIASRFDASDPRDKIYAFLGLANDRQYAPPPRYDIPLEEVLYSFGRFFCEQDPLNCLHLIVAAGSRLRNYRKGVRELPSWVPTWTCGSVALANEDLRTLAASYKHFWNAGGFKYRDPEFEPQTRSLVVQASLLGTIVSTTSVLDGEDLPSEIKQEAILVEYPDFCKEAMAILSRFRTAYSDPVGAYVPTVEAGIVLGMLSYREKESFTRKLSSSTTQNESSSSTLGSEHDAGFERRTREYTSRVSSILKARRFALTSRGLMCLVEYTCLPGDIVCILAGVRVPFVLRPKGDGYEIVCYCYVEGLMFGELTGQLRMQNIRIV